MPFITYDTHLQTKFICSTISFTCCESERFNHNKKLVSGNKLKIMTTKINDFHKKITIYAIKHQFNLVEEDTRQETYLLWDRATLRFTVLPKIVSNCEILDRTLVWP